MSEKQQLAIVTGSSSGIGLALAQQLLHQGWTVVGLARRPAPLVHDHYTHLEADLGQLEKLSTLVETKLAPLLNDSPWQRIALVNNAAMIGALTWMHQVNPAFLGQMFAVNAAAPAYLMGWLSGQVSADTSLRVVNVSSGAAHSPFPGLGDYSATKAALRMSGLVLTTEWAQAGRTPTQASLLSYEPGVVDTTMQDLARATDPEDFPAHAAFQGFSDEGLLVQPQQVVGEMVEFLESDPEQGFTELRFEAG